jgi:hypothetical protein
MHRAEQTALLTQSEAVGPLRLYMLENQAVRHAIRVSRWTLDNWRKNVASRRSLSVRY